MRLHADPDDGELPDFLIGQHLAETDLRLQSVDHLLRLEQVRLVGGEGEVGGRRAAAMADVLDDHVHVDGRVAERLEDARGHARFVGHAHEGDLGLIFIERDAADDDAFHAFGFFFHKGSWVVIEAGADFKHDAEFLGEFHRAALHDLGPEAGEFEHLVIGNFRQLGRRGHQAGVGGVDAVHIRINLAEVGLQCGGQGDGGQIRAAAAERGDLALGGLALEAGHDDDMAGVQLFVDLSGGDVVDFGFGVDGIGDDAGLGAGERHGGDFQGVQGDGSEGDGLLFARGQQHVHLPFTRQRRDVLGQLDEAVGDAAHGGDHHHDLVALGVVLGHAGGDIFDAVGVAHRGAAVFLNNQCHTKLWKLPEQCLAPRNRSASLTRERAFEKAELEVRRPGR